jgi:hypothetical protein
MPSGLSFGLNLVSLIVFLLPGLAGVKIGLLIADRADWLNRVDTIALSFGVSLAAMGSVYMWHSVFARELLTIDAISPIWNTVPLGIITYLDVLGISLVVGILLGVFDFGGEYMARRGGLWYTFFSEIESEPDSEKYQVRVRMQSGDELWGRVEDNGEISVNRDILLENPRRVIRGEDGSIGETYRYTGTAYLHNQGIAHIEFDRLKTADEVGGEDVQFDSLRRDANSEATETNEEAATKVENDAEMEDLEDLAKEADSENGVSEHGDTTY